MDVRPIGRVGVLQLRSIGQVQIEPTVEIEIQPGDSSTHDLWQKVASRNGIGMEGVLQLQLFGPIDKHRPD